MAYDFHGSWERVADHHSRLADTGKESVYWLTHGHLIYISLKCPYRTPTKIDIDIINVILFR